MSIYSDCSQAIADLAELPAVFTEIDVVNQAASDGWSKANFKEARKYANQIVSAKFRSGEVVRYGAVEYEGIQDYARRASMIVYGGAANGPATWDTPNGSFGQIPRHLDTIQTSGRKKGTARHEIEEIVTDLVGEVEERVEERVTKVERRMDGLMAFAGQS